MAEFWIRSALDRLPYGDSGGGVKLGESQKPVQGSFSAPSAGLPRISAGRGTSSPTEAGGQALILPFPRISTGRSTSSPTEAGGEALIQPFPYAAMIRAALQKEQVSTARKLLEIALLQEPREPALSALQRILAPARVTTRTSRHSDRAAEYRWLDLNARQYRGQWVAVSGEELLAYACSLKELMAHLSTREQTRKPLVYRVDDE